MARQYGLATNRRAGLEYRCLQVRRSAVFSRAGASPPSDPGTPDGRRPRRDAIRRRAADFLTGKRPLDVPASAGALPISFPEECMKRIDKSVASQIENTQHETTGAVTAQVENMQAAWTDAWNQQLSRSGEIYGRLFAGMRDELTTFWQK